MAVMIQELIYFVESGHKNYVSGIKWCFAFVIYKILSDIIEVHSAYNLVSSSDKLFSQSHPVIA